MQRMFAIILIIAIAAIAYTAPKRLTSREMFVQKYEALFGNKPSGNAWVHDGIPYDSDCCGSQVDGLI